MDGLLDLVSDQSQFFGLPSGHEDLNQIRETAKKTAEKHRKAAEKREIELERSKLAAESDHAHKIVAARQESIERGEFFGLEAAELVNRFWEPWNASELHQLMTLIVHYREIRRQDDANPALKWNIPESKQYKIHQEKENRKIEKIKKKKEISKGNASDDNASTNITGVGVGVGAGSIAIGFMSLLSVSEWQLISWKLNRPLESVLKVAERIESKLAKQGRIEQWRWKNESGNNRKGMKIPKLSVPSVASSGSWESSLIPVNEQTIAAEFRQFCVDYSWTPESDGILLKLICQCREKLDYAGKLGRIGREFTLSPHVDDESWNQISQQCGKPLESVLKRWQLLESWGQTGQFPVESWDSISQAGSSAAANGIGGFHHIPDVEEEMQKQKVKENAEKERDRQRVRMAKRRRDEDEDEEDDDESVTRAEFDRSHSARSGSRSKRSRKDDVVLSIRELARGIRL